MAIAPRKARSILPAEAAVQRYWERSQNWAASFLGEAQGRVGSRCCQRWNAPQSALLMVQHQFQKPPTEWLRREKPGGVRRSDKRSQRYAPRQRRSSGCWAGIPEESIPAPSWGRGSVKPLGKARFALPSRRSGDRNSPLRPPPPSARRRGLLRRSARWRGGGGPGAPGGVRRRREAAGPPGATPAGPPRRTPSPRGTVSGRDPRARRAGPAHLGTRRPRAGSLRATAESGGASARAPQRPPPAAVPGSWGGASCRRRHLSGSRWQPGGLSGECRRVRLCRRAAAGQPFSERRWRCCGRVQHRAVPRWHAEEEAPPALGRAGRGSRSSAGWGAAPGALPCGDSPAGRANRSAKWPRSRWELLRRLKWHSNRKNSSGLVIAVTSYAASRMKAGRAVLLWLCHRSAWAVRVCATTIRRTWHFALVEPTSWELGRSGVKKPSYLNEGTHTSRLRVFATCVSWSGEGSTPH